MHRSQSFIATKSGPLAGTARVPGDKSISHRALMLGALADGETIVSGLLEGEDVLATAAAMGAMGAKISAGDDGLWRIRGVGAGNLQEPAGVLDMGNSGTSTRLIVGLVAGHPIAATFTGDASLIKRPMKRVMEPLRQMGAQFLSRDGGRLPLTVHGDTLTPIEYRLPVASAQVKSAIMLAALNTRGVTTVIENHPTRDHTENMLRAFGVPVTVEDLENGAQAIRIDGPQILRGCAIDVPGDPSSAAFPAVAALLQPGSDIRLPGIGINPRRTGLYDTLIEMGGDIVYANRCVQGGEPVADLVVRGSRLRGVTVPAERAPSMIDEFPVLAMAAACADGVTRMTGLAELRVKESDRLKMIADGLVACGVRLEMGEDSLTILGNGKPPRGGAMIATALDHRIAMSFLVLGTVTDAPVSIDDGAPIATSFPNFIDLMTGLGASIAPEGTGTLILPETFTMRKKMSTKTIVGGKMMIGDKPLPLSKAVRAKGEFIFCSGQLPLAGGKLVAGGIEAQARQVLSNVEAIVKEAGAQLSDIVKCTIWLADAGDFAAFNEVYREFFPDQPPARSAVVSGFVVPGALVEVEAIAVLS